MGITSLTSLIDNNPHLLSKIKLCDCSLVIDGFNLSHTLYFQGNLDCRYGGEYELYRAKVLEFFCTLQVCKIKAYVMLDGAYDETALKLQTRVKRHKKRLDACKAVMSLLPKSSKNKDPTMIKMLPLMAIDVFVRACMDSEVEVFRCVGEADAYLAFKANELRCPLLSQDSDFYILDLHYGFLPFDHFDWQTASTAYLDSECSDYDNTVASRKVQERSAEIACKLYKIDKLVSSFTGLDKNLLPLFATLSGNDYVDKSLFCQFFDHIVKPKKSKSKLFCTKNHCAMIGTLNFLCNKSLNEAVDAVLNFMRKDERDDLKNLMLESIKKYDLDEFKPPDDFDVGPNFDYLTYENRRILEIEIGLPDWFYGLCMQHGLSHHFIDISANGHCFLPPLNEDFTRPSVFGKCRQILDAIYGIFLNFANGASEDAKAKAKSSLVEYSRKGCDQRKRDINLESLPPISLSLNDLPNLPVETRRAHFLAFASISDDFIEKLDRFSPSLHLFLIVCHLWAAQNEIDDVTIDLSYFDSLVVLAFMRASLELPKALHSEEVNRNFETNDDFDSAALCFVENFDKLESSPKSKSYQIDVRFMHCLSQWQALVWCCQLLNDLLVRPFKPLIIENFYSGRILWNLNLIFVESPNLVDAFKKINGCDAKIDTNPGSVFDQIKKFREEVLALIPECLFRKREKPKKRRSKNREDGSHIPKKLLNNKFAVLKLD